MKLLKTHDDFVTLAGNIQNALPSITDEEQMDKAVGFMIQSIAGRQISMYDGLLKKKREHLDAAVLKLKDAAEAFDGSEVKDQQLQRTTAWVRQQEEQLAFLESYVQPNMKAAQAAYLEHFDKKWLAWSESRNIANAAKQTAAKAEAEETLKKYTG